MKFEVFQCYSMFLRVSLFLVIFRGRVFGYSQINSEHGRHYRFLGINGREYQNWFLGKCVVRSTIFRTDREVTLRLLTQSSVGRCRRSRVWIRWVCSTCACWVIFWEVQERVAPSMIFAHIECGGLETNSMPYGLFWNREIYCWIFRNVVNRFWKTEIGENTSFAIWHNRPLFPTKLSRSKTSGSR
jgi:hypothetical protein